MLKREILIRDKRVGLRRIETRWRRIGAAENAEGRRGGSRKADAAAKRAAAKRAATASKARHSVAEPGRGRTVGETGRAAGVADGGSVGSRIRLAMSPGWRRCLLILRWRDNASKPGDPLGEI